MSLPFQGQWSQWVVGVSQTQCFNAYPYQNILCFRILLYGKLQCPHWIYKIRAFKYSYDRIRVRQIPVWDNNGNSFIPLIMISPRLFWILPDKPKHVLETNYMGSIMLAIGLTPFVITTSAATGIIPFWVDNYVESNNLIKQSLKLITKFGAMYVWNSNEIGISSPSH